MYLISVPNLKEIHLGEKIVFSWLKFIVVNRCKEEGNVNKIESNFQKHISHKLLIRFSSNLECQVVYMEGIKYVNLIEINPAVIEIWGVENGDLVVPVNNTLVCHTTFLLSNTRPCILMFYKLYQWNSYSLAAGWYLTRITNTTTANPGKILLLIFLLSSYSSLMIAIYICLFILYLVM